MGAPSVKSASQVCSCRWPGETARCGSIVLLFVSLLLNFWYLIFVPVFSPENSFYVQRTRMWESAFQSLYFMFRRKLCNIFYGTLILLTDMLKSSTLLFHV